MTAPNTGSIAVVDGDRLAAALVRPGGMYGEVSVVAETGSTNADLAALARAPGWTGEGGAQVLVSDHQTAGRGRRARGWSAAPGTSQAISVLWRPGRADQWSWLPLVTGIAACDMARAWGVAATLKWPNDLQVSEGRTGPDGAVAGRKLAGLLAERVETAVGPACVLGIGLNTTATAEQLPVPTATSMSMERTGPRGSGDDLDVTGVVADLLVRLEKLLLWWQSGEQDDLIADLYANRCDTLRRRVRADLGGTQVVGDAVRVDADGSLVLLVDRTERSVVAGDVVHLR